MFATCNFNFHKTVQNTCKTVEGLRVPACRVPIDVTSPMALSARVPLLLLLAASVLYGLVRYCSPAIAVEVQIKAAVKKERAYLGVSGNGGTVGIRRSGASWFLYRHGNSTCSLKHPASGKWLTAVNVAPHAPAHLELSERPDFKWNLVDGNQILYGTDLTLDIHDGAHTTLLFKAVKDGPKQKWEIVPSKPSPSPSRR